QLAVMMVVNPQQRRDERLLAADLQELRWQLMQLRRDSRHPVPLLLSSTVATSVARDTVWLSQQQTPPLTLCQPSRRRALWPTGSVRKAVPYRLND
ncbi:hypothetical protein DBB30_24535, partial [Yersinia pestis]